MPRGYELTSYYDALRAMHRKIYSKEVKKLSGVINNFGYLNHNLYGLVISSVNNGLEDNLGELSQYMHHISKADIGVNQSSRLQDFMSPLELRANAMAIRKAVIAISRLSNKATVNDMQRICYEAGQSVGLAFQDLKVCKKGEFNMQLFSPVLSTTPIIKKYDKALKQGTYPKGESIVYSDFRNEEREDLILANKKAFMSVKDELYRIGLYEKGQVKNAYKMLNLGYYFVEDNGCGSLETSVLLFNKDFDSKILYHTELSMNLEKLTMAIQMLKTLPKNSDAQTVYTKMFRVGEKARNQAIATYKMLPEMFSGFYNMYSIAEKTNVIKKEQIDSARKAKTSIINKC